MQNENPAHPLLAPINHCKNRLAENIVCYGLFLVSASSLVAECCATRGPDWLLVDMEASPADRHDLVQMLQALNGARATGMARVARNERQLIEAALDSGALGLMVPKVESADEARAVVDCAYYPPKGRRGVNPVRCSGYFRLLPDYFTEANRSIMTIVQIESAKAVAAANEIAAIEGIDILFIGCGDLACDLGQAGQVEGPEMERAIDRVLKACQQHGKTPGIFAYSLELARRYAGQGFRFIAFGNDLKLMASGLEHHMRSLDESTSS